jgi:hypothetical protein
MFLMVRRQRVFSLWITDGSTKQALSSVLESFFSITYEALTISYQEPINAESFLVDA